MRVAWITVVLVGCGGGPSAPPIDPKVQITSRSCSVQPGGFLNVSVDYAVTLDLGQAFTATIDFGGGAGASPNESFSCGAWSTTFLGNEPRGCEHQQELEPDSATVQHDLGVQLPGEPASFSVAILGSALEAPLSPVMFANDSETVPCTVF